MTAGIVIDPPNVPVPNCALSFEPQQETAPATMAQVWNPPLATALAAPVTLAVIGVPRGVGFVVVPLPNSPKPLYPQHETTPPVSKAQVCQPPKLEVPLIPAPVAASICTADMATVLDGFVVVPVSPSLL